MKKHLLLLALLLASLAGYSQGRTPLLPDPISNTFYRGNPLTMRVLRPDFLPPGQSAQTIGVKAYHYSQKNIELPPDQQPTLNVIDRGVEIVFSPTQTMIIGETGTWLQLTYNGRTVAAGLIRFMTITDNVPSDGVITLPMTIAEGITYQLRVVDGLKGDKGDPGAPGNGQAATQQEAQVGQDQVKYMTPVRTVDAIKAVTDTALNNRVKIGAFNNLNNAVAGKVNRSQQIRVNNGTPVSMNTDIIDLNIPTGTTIDLATQSEAQAGQNNTKAMTPARTVDAVKAVTDTALANRANKNAFNSLSTTVTGKVDKATGIRVNNGTTVPMSGTVIDLTVPVLDLATQSEAEAATNSAKAMTPIRTKDAVKAMTDTAFANRVKLAPFNALATTVTGKVDKTVQIRINGGGTSIPMSSTIVDLDVWSRFSNGAGLNYLNGQYSVILPVPSVTGHSGKVLTNNGSGVSWLQLGTVTSKNASSNPADSLATDKIWDNATVYGIMKDWPLDIDIVTDGISILGTGKSLATWYRVDSNWVKQKAGNALTFVGQNGITVLQNRLTRTITITGPASVTVAPKYTESIEAQRGFPGGDGIKKIGEVGSWFDLTSDLLNWGNSDYPSGTMIIGIWQAQKTEPAPSINFYPGANGIFNSTGVRNEVALFSFNGTAATRIAVSDTSAAIWKGSSGNTEMRTVAFNTVPTVTAGQWYAIVLLYNDAGGTVANATQPSIRCLRVGTTATNKVGGAAKPLGFWMKKTGTAAIPATFDLTECAMGPARFHLSVNGQ